jgi:hypothetical protein
VIGLISWQKDKLSGSVGFGVGIDAAEQEFVIPWIDSRKKGTLGENFQVFWLKHGRIPPVKKIMAL